MRYFSVNLKKMQKTEGGMEMCVQIPEKTAAVIRQQRCKTVLIGFDDGRTISLAQRRKAYATIRDIAEHTGYSPEEMKEIMKVEHMLRMREPEIISLSDCSVTDAREFINTLMEYALKEGIILTESGLLRTDDIDTYLIQCIRYRRCCICGKAAEIHHVDAVGMGHDRRRVDDSGKRIAALCRLHHTIAHQKGWERFSESYHVYGIERRRTECREADIEDE